jgi:hypothetical protein
MKKLFWLLLLAPLTMLAQPGKRPVTKSTAKPVIKPAIKGGFLIEGKLDGYPDGNKPLPQWRADRMVNIQTH